MKQPILDQIEFGLERGLLIIIALMITVITLAMIIRVVLTVIEIVKTAKIQSEEKEEITTSSSDSFRNSFYYNSIEEDVISLDVPLSNEARRLISTYRD